MSKFIANIVQNDSGQPFLVVDEMDEEALRFFEDTSKWEERARWHVSEQGIVLNFVEPNIILGYN